MRHSVVNKEKLAAYHQILCKCDYIIMKLGRTIYVMSDK